MDNEAKFTKSPSEKTKQPITPIENSSCSEEETLLQIANLDSNAEHGDISDSKASVYTSKTATLESDGTSVKNGSISCNSISDNNASYTTLLPKKNQDSSIPTRPIARSIACEAKTELTMNSIHLNKPVTKMTRFSNVPTSPINRSLNKVMTKPILRNSAEKTLGTPRGILNLNGTISRKSSNCSSISKQSASNTNKQNMPGSSFGKSSSSLSVKPDKAIAKTPSSLSSRNNLQASTSSKIPKPSIPSLPSLSRGIGNKNQFLKTMPPKPPGTTAPKPSPRTPTSIRPVGSKYLPKTGPQVSSTLKLELGKKDNKSQGDPVRKPETKSNTRDVLTEYELSVAAKNELGENLDKKKKEDSKHLIELEEKLNAVLCNCAANVKKTNNVDDFRDVLDKIEPGKMPSSERLNGITQLIDKFCSQHSGQKELIGVLQNEVIKLKEVISHFKTNEQNKSKLQGHAEEESKKKDQQLIALKRQLEESKSEIENMKQNIFQKSVELQQANEDRTTLKAAVKEMKSKLEEFDDIVKSKDELQLKFDKTSKELQDNLAAHSQVLQTAKRYFEEMIDLKSQVKELRDGKYALSEKLETVKVGLRESNEKIKAAELQVAKLVGNRNLAESTDFKELLATLQESEKKKEQEIAKLTEELQQALSKINDLNEQIRRDQQLLAVRSTLIVQMQKSEIHQRETIDDLYTQMSEKNRYVTELNNELRLRSEDFKELFSTLGQKQIELQAQAQTLRQLHDSNERNQLLRVTQEEKIALLEDEIVRLRIFIDRKLQD